MRPLVRRALIAVTSAALSAPLVVSPVGPAAADGGQARSNLTWQPCGSSAECTSIDVPLDWNHPGHGSITLAFARHRATDPAARVGTLVFQPGQGVSAMQFVAERIGAGMFPSELIERFDIVGIDQRGGGAPPDPMSPPVDLPVHSTSLHCDRPAHEPASRYFPETAEQFEHLLQYNESFALGCLAGSGPVVAHMDSVNQARDLEAVRRALGEEQLSWMSWTTASEVGLTYLSLYPHRVRAMALDQPSRPGVPVIDYVVGHAAAVQDEFDRFSQWCAASVECDLHGADVAAALSSLVDAANASPLATRMIGHPLTGDELLMLGQDMLGIGDLKTADCGAVEATGFHVLAIAVEMDDPDCLPGIPGFDGLLAWETTYWSSIGWEGAWEQYHAIACGDLEARIGTFAEFQVLAARAREAAPDMRGVSPAWEQVTGCVGWPFAAAAPPRPLRLPSSANVLVVASRPSEWAPYGDAVSLSQRIGGSTLLTYEGDAHISYISSAVCVRDALASYLTSFAAPSTCPQEGPLAGLLP